MKKIQRLLLSAFLSILLMFGFFVPCINVYAVGDVWTNVQSYQYFEEHFNDINTRLNGVIFNQDDLRHSFEDFLSEYRDNYNIPSGTSNSTWIGDNINGTYINGSSGDSDISFSQTFRQCMRDWCNAYIETNTGFNYAYSFGTGRFSSMFSSQDYFHAFLDFVSENEDEYLCVFYGWQDSFYLYPKNCLFTYFSSSNTFINVSIYNNWVLQPQVKEFKYNSTSKTFEELSSVGNNNNCYLTDSLSSSTPSFSVPMLINLNSYKYIIYKSEQAMRNGSEGIQDYYTVSDSYNSTISGSYNTTSNNINCTLNDNDVSNYINNYYIENSAYPTPNQVNVYITNNIDNGSGGSGGSGESGDNDDNNNNFDWGFLGTIGDFLGGLLSGISGVISGLLEGITGIIDLFIGTENSETGQREGGLPNIVGSLIEYFLPFLPPEFLTLIELSLILGLVLGIIRLIRGH